MIKVDSASELSLEFWCLYTSNYPPNRLLSVLIAEASEPTRFQTFEKTGTDGRASGIRTHNLHRHEKFREEFLDFPVNYYTVVGTTYERFYVGFCITVRQVIDDNRFFANVVKFFHV